MNAEKLTTEVATRMFVHVRFVTDGPIQYESPSLRFAVAGPLSFVRHLRLGVSEP